MKARAALASLTLSLMFLIVYGMTNWFTSTRSDVGTWYYAWEKWIPFVPLMVIPYMSIDLFFVSAPFLLATRQELSTFSRRVAFAIAAGGLLFLAMPLQLAVERPVLEGWLGAAFGWFFSMDQPYNLCPSLHIALRTLLAETYARYTSGFLNLVCHAWFSLIGVSTLLTYQHHVVDVAGGFILAGICFYLFPSISARQPVVPNWRVGGLYLTVAMLAGLLAVLQWPAGAWLLWPAVAAAITAGAYAGSGPGIYRKQLGRIPLSTRLVLAPVLTGHAASWWYYKRQCRAWDELIPGIWIGRLLTESEAQEAERAGARAVLDLTAELTAPATFRALHYHNVPILDLTAPTDDQLDDCLQFIRDRAGQGVVYIHCKAGYSRTAAVAGCYLLATGKARTADEAMALLRQSRPTIVIRPEAEQAIRAYANRVAKGSARIPVAGPECGSSQLG